MSLQEPGLEAEGGEDNRSWGRVGWEQVVGAGQAGDRRRKRGEEKGCGHRRTGHHSFSTPILHTHNAPVTEPPGHRDVRSVAPLETTEPSLSASTALLKSAVSCHPPNSCILYLRGLRLKT